MQETEEIPRSYAEAVRALIKAHAESGPADLRILFFPDPQEQTVRLLLVSDDFQQTGVVRPLPLGRSADFPFRSAVALLTSDELTRVESGQMSLPAGWDLTSAHEVRP